MTKRFALSRSQIRPIAKGYGSCIATDQITVEGKRVGFMYRAPPGAPPDSGWRFFSGEESQDYVDDPNNLAIYNVNTIANYDESIIPLLSAPIGSAFGRDVDGEFQREPLPDDPDAPPSLKAC